MKRTTHRGAMVVIAVIASVVSAGCGVRTQSEPEAIDRDDVPFDLLLRSPRANPSPSVPGSNAYVVYVIGGNGIVPTTRSQARPLTLRERLRQLVQGVTAEEAALGLRSAIPAGSTVRRVAVRGGVATVDLGGRFDHVSDQSRLAAFAQLVFTATEAPAVTHVRVELDGRRIDAPTVDGRLTVDPVSRDDYALTAGSPGSMTSS